jgi:glyoxylase-like metal-dependent hydrolase (beta-lactamase superfamily II)
MSSFVIVGLKRLEVTKGIHYVDGSNANSYFIEEAGGSLTLVDTGIQPDGKKILGYLTAKMMRKPSDVKTIVLTHCHVDHVRGAATLKAATGAKVAIHEADADFVSGKTKYPSPGGMTGLLFALMSPFFRSPPVEPDIRLKENDSIGRFVVLHTPGHTPGSISLYDRAGKVLFVGDAVRYIKGKLQGPPPQFTPDMGQAKVSIERLSQLDFNVVLSGHGEPLKSNDAAQMLKELPKRL